MSLAVRSSSPRLRSALVPSARCSAIAVTTWPQESDEPNRIRRERVAVSCGELKDEGFRRGWDFRRRAQAIRSTDGDRRRGPYH